MLKSQSFIKFFFIKSLWHLGFTRGPIPRGLVSRPRGLPGVAARPRGLSSDPKEQSLCSLTFMNVPMIKMRTFVKNLLISLEFVTGYDWLWIALLAMTGLTGYELPHRLWLSCLAMTKLTGYIELPDLLWLTWLALTVYVWYPVLLWLNWLAMKCLDGLWIDWLAMNSLNGYEFSYWLWIIWLAINFWLWLAMSYSRSWVSLNLVWLH